MAPTEEEIERRVKEADAVRSARRSAAARRVGELAQRRAAIAEQLSDIERELGEVLAESRDVIDLDELARFTDVPATDLTRWLDGRKTTRTKRKKTASGSGAKNAPGRPPSTAGPSTATPASTPREPAVPGDSTASRPARATPEVT